LKLLTEILNPKKKNKPKTNVAREIEHPTVDTPVTPPTQTKAKRTKNTTTTTQGNVSPQQSPQTNQKKTTTQKKRKNRVELEVIVRDVVNGTESVIGVIDNDGFNVTDQEAHRRYNLAQYF